ncbi:MAG: gamma carbonic anhydrase family protein [Candidatus Abyssobacteria bacterium SURF_17]|uniref:Gamma carbonic anhydrase family protein n=1 Tax=Candidatus Abyssobacteria bacterium SURF_17 TaxID=2093361 RepID=A0A419EXU1_9BACT|nr:MAG: gamma carbonic anhydrase family protein [Candidatus Abyssubacteria bacterium SURF_17]
MAIYEFEGKIPVVGEGSFVHPEATLIGGVKIGRNCFIGPGARLRADWCDIEVDDGSNVQDNCIIHARPEFTVRLGPNSHIGHGSVLHGVVLHEHVLVGMNAVIQDFAEIGENCIIGSGCVIAPGMHVPPRKLVVGVPGKIVADVSPEQEQLWTLATHFYQELARRYREGSRLK